jgi:fluoride exporter
MLTIAVMVAAGVGAVARYVVDQFVQHRMPGTFPAGTLLVNLSGSLLLGVVTGLAAHHGLPSRPTVVLGAGFAGGYTTFSTLAWETLALGEAGAVGQAMLNLVGSLVLGLAVAAAGLGLALL